MRRTSHNKVVKTVIQAKSVTSHFAWINVFATYHIVTLHCITLQSSHAVLSHTVKVTSLTDLIQLLVYVLNVVRHDDH